MDPQACWRHYCEAVRSNGWDEAREARYEYNDWIGRGGFPANDGADPIAYIVNDAGDYNAVVDGDTRRRTVDAATPSNARVGR